MMVGRGDEMEHCNRSVQDAVFDSIAAPKVFHEIDGGHFGLLWSPGSIFDEMKWFSDLQRVTTSPENAIKIRKACDDIDVMDLLPQVRARTLVLHSRNESVVPFEHGRMVASHIPGARFVGLDSTNHIIMPQEPAWKIFVTEIDLFLSEPLP
jgi:hypothetical protein